MTFEERVLAAKVKLDEAVGDLLDMVVERPGAAPDICQILNPGQRTAPGMECRDFFRSQVFRDGVEKADDELELTPYSHVFERRHIDREEDPDVLLVKGSVMLILSLTPEDEAESDRYRQLAREAGR